MTSSRLTKMLQQLDLLLTGCSESGIPQVIEQWILEKETNVYLADGLSVIIVNVWEKSPRVSLSPPVTDKVKQNWERSPTIDTRNQLLTLLTELRNNVDPDETPHADPFSEQRPAASEGT